MEFIKTLWSGEKGLFKPDGLTPMQKITLRFVVVALVFYGIVVIEGMLMRIYEIEPVLLTGKDLQERCC
jgi:cytochrome c oxidase subunit 1